MIVYPVIHFESPIQAQRNASKAFEVGAQGVFLIDMTGRQEMTCVLTAENLKKNNPDKKIGVNILTRNSLEALADTMAFNLDMFWSDFPRISSTKIDHEMHDAIRKVLPQTEIEFFASVAFKGQDKEKNPGLAAQAVAAMGYVTTTSGTNTGIAPPVDKIKTMREALDKLGSPERLPLAIASGLDPDNIESFLPYATHALVATGVSDCFSELSSDLLQDFMNKVNKN